MFLRWCQAESFCRLFCDVDSRQIGSKRVKYNDTEAGYNRAICSHDSPRIHPFFMLLGIGFYFWISPRFSIDKNISIFSNIPLEEVWNRTMFVNIFQGRLRVFLGSFHVAICVTCVYFTTHFDVRQKSFSVLLLKHTRQAPFHVNRDLDITASVESNEIEKRFSCTQNIHFQSSCVLRKPVDFLKNWLCDRIFLLAGEFVILFSLPLPFLGGPAWLNFVFQAIFHVTKPREVNK